MKPKTTEMMGLAPYDSADYLNDEQDISADRQTVMAEDSEDPVHPARALGLVVRTRNMSQLARDSGLTREGVRTALAPSGNPIFAKVAKVAKALRFRLKLAPLGEVFGKSHGLTR